jgi:hypothetical protein
MTRLQDLSAMALFMPGGYLHRRAPHVRAGDSRLGRAIGGPVPDARL